MRRIAAVAVAVAVAAGVLAVTGCAAAPPPVAAPTVQAGSTAAASVSPSAAARTAPRVLGVGAPPASVRIPAIDLDEPLIRLGVLPDGTMGVPADWDDVGWFSGGGRPGGRGPTVIAAHVDSVTAPAVFSRLDELRPDDRVVVTDVEGRDFAYRVTEAFDVPKAEFPTMRVFGARPSDELRLITCGGVFDPAAAAYEDNRVVFAERV